MKVKIRAIKVGERLRERSEIKVMNGHYFMSKKNILAKVPMFHFFYIEFYRSQDSTFLIQILG